MEFEAILDAAVAKVSDVIAEAGMDRLDEHERLELNLVLDNLLHERDSKNAMDLSRPDAWELTFHLDTE